LASAGAHGLGARGATLGAGGAISLVAGSMLGIGIFIAPPVVASHTTGPVSFLLLWLIGGLSALFGALCLAELGAMMPRAGGDYPYLRLAYGDGPAFAVGWLQLLAIFPGSLAAMAVGTATFQLPVLLGSWHAAPVAALGLPIAPASVWAVVIVLAITALNHAGLKLSGRAQVLVTAVPVAILLAISLSVLGSALTAERAPAASAASSAPSAGWDVSGLALAYLPVYFAYSGWYSALFVGAEVRDPARNLPRALIGGTLGVTVLYLLLCAGFLAVFSLDRLAEVGEAGTAAAQALFGPGGELVVTALILLAMLGSINGTVLTGGRIAYAMAEHGHCPAAAGQVSPRYGTPVFALWMQAAWTLVLIGWGGFEALLNYATAAMLITGTLTVWSVGVLRRRYPDLPRPYRTWGWPWSPWIYAASSAVVLAILIASGDPSVLAAVGWFFTATVVHRLGWGRGGGGDGRVRASLQEFAGEPAPPAAPR
jgi:APA family basic amino acid/polyamine antiporter